MIQIFVKFLEIACIISFENIVITLECVIIPMTYNICSGVKDFYRCREKFIGCQDF